MDAQSYSPMLLTLARSGARGAPTIVGSGQSIVGLVPTYLVALFTNPARSGPAVFALVIHGRRSRRGSYGNARSGAMGAHTIGKERMADIIGLDTRPAKIVRGLETVAIGSREVLGLQIS
jgi:hypothetical protein